MNTKFLFICEYVPISWTKRYVRRRPMSINTIIRREKFRNRIKKRPINALIKDSLKLKRGRFLSRNKSRRQNFNDFYRPIQIR